MVASTLSFVCLCVVCCVFVFTCFAEFHIFHRLNIYKCYKHVNAMRMFSITSTLSETTSPQAING